MLAVQEAPSKLIRGLGNAVGPQYVYTRAADLASYAYDAFGASGDREVPLAVVFPQTTEQLCHVVAECAHHRVPVIPRGAGTGYSSGAIGSGAVIVSMVRMNRLSEVDTRAQRVTAEAGVITSAIHHAADAAGLYYPPDPGSSTTSTIGGNVACNASGAHSLRYGSTSDYVSDLEIVLADGKRLAIGESYGGGYDVAGLICGSEGTLGFISAVTLRLITAPASRATLRAVFGDMQSAADAVAAIAKAGVVPAALECLDTAAIDAVRNSGVADVPEGVGAMIIAEVEGDQRVTDRDAELVRSALLEAGAGEVDHARNPAEANSLWAARKGVSAAVATIMIGKVNEDVVVPRDRVGELCERVRSIGVEHEVPSLVFGHLGEGNMHVTFLIDPRVPGERRRADAAAESLFETVLAMDGSLTGEHGIGTAKVGWVERQIGAGTIALMRRIKEEFDPAGLMNPGKKIPAERRSR
jgi:glycolate oxidase